MKSWLRAILGALYEPGPPLLLWVGIAAGEAMHHYGLSLEVRGVVAIAVLAALMLGARWRP